MNKFEQYISEELEMKNELVSLFDTSEEIVIFDIGTCEAEDSIKYSNLFPNSKIFAFEPVPENFDKGKKNIEIYKKENIKIFPFALSNVNGTANFFVSNGHPEYLDKDEFWDYGNKSSSLFAPKEVSRCYSWLSFNKTIIVKTKTIESFCSENVINKIDFMHIDVQGAEGLVLSGAGDMISKVKSIWLEVESVELYKNQPLKNEIYDFLIKNNFNIIKDTCSEISGDLFCVNNKI